MNATQAPHDEVARRAYYLWEERGRPDGRNDEFWFEAEHELNAEQNENVETHDGDDADSSAAPPTLDLHGGTEISNTDRALPPMERRRARAEEHARRGERVSKESPAETAERFIVVLDAAHLRIYRANWPATGNRSPHFEVARSIDIPGGRQSYASRDTDQAGRFPYSRGTNKGGSIDERLPMQEEQERRVAAELAGHVGQFLQQHPNAAWDFAAGPQLHNAVLRKLPMTIRDRVGRTVDKDLVNQPLQSLREHFPNPEEA